jgi:hypothetical protein
VGGGDQSPLGAAGGQASALEAIDAPEEFGVGEDRFDDLLSAAVERAAVAGFKDRFDALGFVALAGRQRPCCGAGRALGRDQDL